MKMKRRRGNATLLTFVAHLLEGGESSSSSAALSLGSRPLSSKWSLRSNRLASRPSKACCFVRSQGGISIVSRRSEVSTPHSSRDLKIDEPNRIRSRQASSPRYFISSSEGVESSSSPYYNKNIGDEVLVYRDPRRRGSGRHFFRCPVGSELCGPRFTPDGETLFLAVQHPGDGEGASFEAPTTRWPDFIDTAPPRPSVMVITRSGGGPIGG